MDPKERAIRSFYEARERRDWDAVGSHLAEDVLWHEPGEEDYSGDHRGRDAAVALLRKLNEVTAGTFRLAPEAFVGSAEHSAAVIRWSAERRDTRVEGKEIAVFRFRGEEIVEAWFHSDGYDPEALSAVFSYD